MANSLVEISNRIIRENPEKTQQARANPKLVGWFVGQVMKASNGAYSQHAVRQVLARRGLEVPPDHDFQFLSE